MKLKPFQTLFVGQHQFRPDETDSTNTYAAELLLHSHCPEGTVVLTYIQKQGRGQRGNYWESEPFKNLTFSIIFYPVFLLPHEQFCLNEAVTLGIYDYIKKITGEKTKIKWSNDIYYNDDKIAGVLIENTVRSDKIIYSIAGIGLNVNQTKFSGNAANPTSLKLITGKDFETEECLSELCFHVEKRYLQAKAGNREILHNDFTKALYRLNEFHYYLHNSEKLYGKIIKVGQNGLLFLELKDKTVCSFDFREIKFLH